MGALIAFELLRLLRRRQGPSPIHLFVSGFRSPEFPRRRRSIHQLPDAEFLEELRCYGGTPEQIFAHQELLRLLLPALRADFALHETYRYYPEPPLACPISVFGGADDTLVNQSELLGWRAHTRAQFRVHMLPGDHFFLNTAHSLLLAAIHADLGI
jgi:medium-chain acyl-[acyl-carrier-protein] hydrolase